jgi:hypothetical protein
VGVSFFYENSNWWLGNRIFFSDVENFDYPLVNFQIIIF